MIPVNVRLPEALVKPIDNWINEGRFSSRSEAIKSMIAFYEEREKTRQFAEMLLARSREAKENPDDLVPLDEVE